MMIDYHNEKNSVKSVELKSKFLKEMQVESRYVKHREKTKYTLCDKEQFVEYEIVGENDVRLFLSFTQS